MASAITGRVLILENDYCNRILFADYLDHCGYCVRALADERQLLHVLKDFQPQVLLLNLRMPVIDGFTVIETLRCHAQWAQLSILVVSGYTRAQDRQKAYQLGANDYLTKPVMPSDLSAAVERLLCCIKR
ncbi:MAG: response regulator [Cyanobacteria bacterium P01_A01_bin.116]